MKKLIVPAITLSDVNKKTLKILAYLLGSGFLGWVLATYVAKDPALSTIFAPAINFALYELEKELKGEGYINALGNQQ